MLKFKKGDKVEWRHKGRILSGTIVSLVQERALIVGFKGTNLRQRIATERVLQ